MRLLPACDMMVSGTVKTFVARGIFIISRLADGMRDGNKLSAAQRLGIFSRSGVCKVCKGVDKMGHRGKTGSGGSLLDRYALTQQKAGHFDAVHIDVGGQCQSGFSFEGVAQRVFAGVKFIGEFIQGNPPGKVIINISENGGEPFVIPEKLIGLFLLSILQDGGSHQKHLHKAAYIHQIIAKF